MTPLNTALAQSLPLDTSLFSDPSQLLPAGTATEIIKTVGQFADQRPYEPASPLGTSAGVDLGIEVTLMRVPDSFTAKLQEAGVSSGTELPPAVPLPRIHLHKGIGKRVDIGVSWIGYQDYRIYGGDVKVVLFNPDQGPVWALRLGYANARLGFVFSKTWTPQLLISRPLHFAEPYLGIGYQIITGKIAVPVPLPAPFDDQAATINSEGKAQSFMAFTGVGFTLGPTGIRLTLEGAYNQKGAHTLGTKVGLRF